MPFRQNTRVGFFCPYTGKDWNDEAGTLEHIIPQALGGSDVFTIVAERQANGALGADVDSHVGEIYKWPRVKYDLRGHSGIAPTLKWHVKVPQLAGLKAKWEQTTTGGGLTLKPRVTRRLLPNGKTQVRVEGSPAEAKAIFDRIRQKHEHAGQVVDEPKIEERRIDQPTIEGHLTFDLVALGRFPFKVALGVGHLLWGES